MSRNRLFHVVQFNFFAEKQQNETREIRDSGYEQKEKKLTPNENLLTAIGNKTNSHVRAVRIVCLQMRKIVELTCCTRRVI